MGVWERHPALSSCYREAGLPAPPSPLHFEKPSVLTRGKAAATWFRLLGGYVKFLGHRAEQEALLSTRTFSENGSHWNWWLTLHTSLYLCLL